MRPDLVVLRAAEEVRRAIRAVVASCPEALAMIGMPFTEARMDRQIDGL